VATSAANALTRSWWRPAGFGPQQPRGAPKPLPARHHRQNIQQLPLKQTTVSLSP